MKALVIVCLLASPARAGWRELAERWGGVAWLHLEATVLERIDAAPPGFSELALAGARLHGLATPNSWIAYHVGIDIAAGSTLRGAGFAYDVALFPVGAAVRFGETSFVALGAGVGAIGAVGTLDDAATFPLELTVEAGGSVRVLARARASLLAGAARRDHELEGSLALRIGHRYHDFDFPSGNGYVIGVAYRDLEGARFVGATIGYSIDLATPRHVVK